VILEKPNLRVGKFNWLIHLRFFHCLINWKIVGMLKLVTRIGSIAELLQLISLMISRTNIIFYAVKTGKNYSSCD
jgi:hypothetical protein